MSDPESTPNEPTTRPPAPARPETAHAAGSKARSLAIIAVSYVLATAIGILTGWLAGLDDPLWLAFVFDVAATVVIFIWSLAYDNSSFYDAYWSVVPMGLVAYWAAVGDARVDLRLWAVIAVVWIWGARLTFNWARGWTGLDHEDWRYVDFREKTPRGFYWLLSFSGIHFFPTLIVFAGLLPAWNALSQPGRPLGWLDGLGLAVGGAGIFFEWLADRQLRAFVRSKPAPGTTLRTGLWRYSRHPNYFGENLVWWGLLCFGAAAEPSWIWSYVGAPAMTAMFLVVSIPMIEERARKRRPGYQQVIDETSMLLPLPPRRRARAPAST